MPRIEDDGKFNSVALRLSRTQLPKTNLEQGERGGERKVCMGLALPPLCWDWAHAGTRSLGLGGLERLQALGGQSSPPLRREPLLSCTASHSVTKQDILHLKAPAR